MYFFNNQLIQHIKRVYKSLIITEPEIGNSFFETFAPGNHTYFIDKPYERFSDYENLLKILHKDDPEKYYLIQN